MRIEFTHDIEGDILDIGGGGEGIIGRMYGERVTAIDNSQEELDEAPGGFKKLLMDATDLKFADKSFDGATFFYALMYMTEQQQKAAIAEAARVLKASGTLYIWDCDIENASHDPFCVDLDIAVQGENIHTTYGIIKDDRQSQASIAAMCEDAGLAVVKSCEIDGNFYLRCVK